MTGLLIFASIWAVGMVAVTAWAGLYRHHTRTQQHREEAATAAEAADGIAQIEQILRLEAEL